MSQLESFSVQTCAYDGDDVLTHGCVHVEALSPLHAGEIVLGEMLCIHGPIEKARARVWKLSDDYAPVNVMLYQAA